MAAFLLRRVAGLAGVLAVAVVVTFAAVHALPGNPVAVMLSDHSADRAMAGRLAAAYGLDQPIGVQFLRYVGGILSRISACRSVTSTRLSRRYSRKAWSSARSWRWRRWPRR
jgi:ABC-type dipeptide/oligopeptide/nickel transport system permease component